MSDGTPKLSDEEFISIFRHHGPAGTAKIAGCSERGVYARRNRLAKIYGGLETPSKGKPKEYPHRGNAEIKNGIVIIASDLHLWPGYESVALRALKKLAKELEPAAFVLNGDVLDFPQISRHARIGWESQPTVIEEIECAQNHLHEIEQALKRGCLKWWCMGNHDARFETRLAAVAPEYANIKGIHLSDHFPNWTKAWSVWINDEVVIKHRWKGGIHATHNNTLWAGKTMVTGHLHSQKITPFTDYGGTRYGIDTGCVADTDQKTFINYTEDNPLNWRSGFCVLTFLDGQLLYPELVTKWDENHVQFRGKLVKL
jgi:hypothetical protein